MDDGYKQQKLYITHHVLQRLLHQVKHPAGSNTYGRRHQASIDLPWLRSGRQRAASNAAKYLSPLPCASHALASSQAAMTTKSPEVLMHLPSTALASCPFGR